MKTNFFEYLDFALQFAPAGPEEKAIRAKLARIGVGPGKTFDFKDLSLEHKAEIGLGMKEGDKQVGTKAASARQEHQRLARRLRLSATATSTRATGCSVRPPPRLVSTATDAVEAVYP